MKKWLVSLALLVQVTHAFAGMPQVSSGSLERIDNMPSKFIPARHVDVWLPQGYSEAKKYKVLYMHDGQMLFDANTTWNKKEWRVDEVVSTLITDGQIEPIIVVGIHNGGVKRRHSEYFPQAVFEGFTKEYQQQVLAEQRSADAPLFYEPVDSDNYLKFITQELIPYIDANYSTQQNSEARVLMGSSMGGLISWYGLSRYPQYFAGAACLSTHWPGTMNRDGVVADAFNQYLAAQLPRLQDKRIYFDYGDQTLDALYPPLQRAVDKTFGQGFAKQNWQSLFFKGHSHDETAWAERLHHPLNFFFKVKAN
ncbi:alpha/beta hydrolase [Paraferrimonas sp. SM1919]|uniref:alpha/beta hydrolase n=1 Tax=Paraferrimonas sp. SM1919 TaxID=2662263 RepID=UPI0013D5E55D|nr:alpha/beta hydrolase-fold protein [Paraferrimonas sp. SM1919]